MWPKSKNFKNNKKKKHGLKKISKNSSLDQNRAKGVASLVFFHNLTLTLSVVTCVCLTSPIPLGSFQAHLFENKLFHFHRGAGSWGTQINLKNNTIISF